MWPVPSETYFNQLNWQKLDTLFVIRMCSKCNMSHPHSTYVHSGGGFTVILSHHHHHCTFHPCEFQNISFINLQFFTLDNMTVVLPLLVQRQFYMMAVLFTYQLGSIVLVSLSMIAIYSWINYLIISLCCCMNTNGYNGSPITRLLPHRGRSVGVCALLQLCVPLEKSSPALQVILRSGKYSVYCWCCCCFNGK